jgi:hypothetical protein
VSQKSSNLTETAAKLAAALAALAAAKAASGRHETWYQSHRDDRETRRENRNRERDRRHQPVMHQPGSGRGQGGPSLIIGGMMVALGFLLLMVMIGPQLFVNMGLAMTVCLAPFAVVALIVITAITRTEREKKSRTAESTRSDAPPAAEPFSIPKAASSIFRPEKEKPPPPPAHYRERATAYRLRIQTVIRNRRKGPLAETIAAILPRLERWEERVTQLANRLGNFESDKIIQRDIQEAPQNIARLQKQIEREADPAVRDQMEKTLAGYEEQQTQLEALVRLMRRTRLQLDDTLASMGTIYSQVQMLDAMDLDGGRATQIADEIEGEVGRLNDLLSAFGEMNASSSTDLLSEAARRIRLQ